MTGLRNYLNTFDDFMLLKLTIGIISSIFPVLSLCFYQKKITEIFTLLIVKI